MSAIRVMIGDMPPMLQSMVVAMLQSEDDILLIDSDAAEAARQDNRADVNVILTSLSRLQSDATYLGDLASLSPNGIVAIADNAREATIIHFTKSHWPLLDSRKDSIGAAIRTAAQFSVKH
jgi:hypothetical protein